MSAEEKSPERLVRLGKLAEGFQRRGNLDEALRIHREERMPMAEVLADKDSLAHIHGSIGKLLLEKAQKGNPPEAQAIFDNLSTAYKLSVEIQRVDFISHIGMMLGQVLIKGGYKDKARPILDTAVKGFRQLGEEDAARTAEHLIATHLAGTAAAQTSGAS